MRVISLFAVLLLVGCSTGGPLGAVTSGPPPQSPELREQRNRIDVQYQLRGPAEVSTRVVAPDGEAWTLYERSPRPTRGSYVFQFDGTVPGPGPNERSALPDGDYTIILVADSSAQAQRAEVQYQVRNADTVKPEIADLAILPERISPNFDARDDVANLSFRLAKEARVALFLDTLDDDGQTRRVWMGEEVRTPAGEQALVWDGLANGVPVDSGSYQLGVRARDTSGNVVERSQPLVVEDAGVAEASIVVARIGPRQIIRGEQVCLEAVVRNTGQTVLRTAGPEPGYVYNSLDSYSSIEGHRFGEHAGYWRVGLNWSGGSDVTGATYPYRWGFGRDLSPGEEASVHGCVRILNEQDKLTYFAGLVQENVAIHSAGAGLVRVDVSS